ncbi:hypothetical protein SCLCIDRAFT_1046715 [Scleroderma citrinum Foug A]|uniref:Uncharacterized protein n=1 Tax=Scleroderma citrinum Foug A TaxID=1036808 RepID=A0A0C3DRJ2_9AGAM|nr:hypothetical protein SCLCIDRAFT_1046715 [Scleroderma citrinum Foug A]
MGNRLLLGGCLQTALMQKSRNLGPWVPRGEGPDIPPLQMPSTSVADVSVTQSQEVVNGNTAHDLGTVTGTNSTPRTTDVVPVPDMHHPGSQENIVDSFVDHDAVISYLLPMKAFQGIVNMIPDTHPYAKLALYTLSWAAKALIAQMNMDQSVVDLLSKISHVYASIKEEFLMNVAQMKESLMAISRLVINCVRFIQSYAEIKSFWNCTRKNVLYETNKIISTCNNVFDVLMQWSGGMMKLDTHFVVKKVLDDMSHILDGIHAGSLLVESLSIIQHLQPHLM